MLCRKSFLIILVALLALILVSCNKSSTGRNVQNTNATNNKPELTAQSTPSANNRVSNKNQSSMNSIISDILTGNTRRNADDTKRLANMAANNYLKPVTHDGPKKCISIQRSFENHPQLEKVVENHLNGSCKIFKYDVYLRRGKICEVPKGKIKALSTVSAEELLQAIGTCIQD